jgi:hypothetical protein
VPKSSKLAGSSMGDGKDKCATRQEGSGGKTVWKVFSMAKLAAFRDRLEFYSCSVYRTFNVGLNGLVNILRLTCCKRIEGHPLTA